MSKLKLFIENFLIYGLGGIISKLIPLVMVPIITRIMPTTDYFGISDLSNTVISFASALAIMGIYDAMYRMFFEKEDNEYKKRVCSTAMIFTLATSLSVFVIMLLGRKIIAEFFFNNKEYAYVVYLSAMATLVGGTNVIISAPTRMQNKRKIFLITNTLSPLISYGIAIPMLFAGYYVIALPLAAVISGLTLEISFWFLNKEWFSFNRFDKELLMPMLKIAIPLLPNFLIYWLFNSCDKVMITNILGIGAAGIYSVGSKLGNCSQLIYTAFAGGWQYFALSTMKEENQIESNSLVFEYLGLLSFVASAFVCAWSYPIFKILFTEQYVSGYIVAPYLFLAPLLQMLFQVAASQFLVIKKTWPNMFILGTGAIVNVMINWRLIPVLGIEGASIATLLGYTIADMVCVIVLCKMKLMVVSRKFILSFLLMIVYYLIWRILFNDQVLMSTAIALCFVMLLIVLYREDIRRFKELIEKRSKHE